MNILWDLLQQYQIGEARKEAETASKTAKDLKREINGTPDRFSQLTLITAAVWELLKEKHGLDEIDLMNKMEEIDLRDGKKDGKCSSSIVLCLGCGRKIRNSHKECIYCGAPNNSYSPFTKVTDK